MLKLLTLWLVPSFSQRLYKNAWKFWDIVYSLQCRSFKIKIWAFGVIKTGLIAKINIKYVLPTCIWKYFRRILRFLGNFAGPQPCEISEALFFLHVGCQQTSSQNLLAIIMLVKQTEKY